MKNIFLCLLFFCGLLSAQTVVIPDINFKNKLLSASSDNEVAKNEMGNFIAVDSNADGLSRNLKQIRLLILMFLLH